MQLQFATPHLEALIEAAGEEAEEAASELVRMRELSALLAAHVCAVKLQTDATLSGVAPLLGKPY